MLLEENFVTETTNLICSHPTPINNVNSISAHWLKLHNFSIGMVEKNINYLSIDGSYKDTGPPRINMEKGFYKERFKFWEGLPLAENIEELNQIHVDI